MKLAVHREPEQAEEQAVMLDRHRHRRRDHVRAIAGDDQIDFIDIEQLGVNPGHRRRIALVVVIDELDRPAEKPALRVDVVLPDLHREQRRLAGGGKPAGQRHAETDCYRLGRSGGTGRNNASGEHCRRCHPAMSWFDHCCLPNSVRSAARFEPARYPLPRIKRLTPSLSRMR